MTTPLRGDAPDRDEVVLTAHVVVEPGDRDPGVILGELHDAIHDAGFQNVTCAIPEKCDWPAPEQSRGDK